MLVESANKSYQAYKVMVVVHIYKIILDIPLPGYLGNKSHILMLIKVCVVYIDLNCHIGMCSSICRNVSYLTCKTANLKSLHYLSSCTGSIKNGRLGNPGS